MRKVTVFGSARPVPGESAYEEALHLGSQLALLQLGVITGGYMGTMEAVSQGAAMNGGEVIGVTCAEIEAWRPTPHNVWIQRVIHCQTLEERIQTMIRQGDAGIIALPGGIGTLAEIMLFWNHIGIHPDDQRPFILIGEGWQKTITGFLDAQCIHVSEKLPPNLHFENTIAAALQWFMPKSISRV
jgi:uncharacterized protein (TIGR00730 family)